MKTKYIFIGIALACVLGACSRDEESLFDKNASERAQEALDNANEVLIAPEFGWEMIYFANPASKGYNLIVKFDKDGRFIATAKNRETTNNNILTDSVSTWQVKLDYGPILTFDTYNDVLHAWADPGTDGDGLLGDYEFLILSATPERIKLKGKKHSSYCYLYPLTEQVEPATYFADVEAMQSKLFANNNILEWTSNGQTFQLHNGSSGIFSLTEVGASVNLEDEDIYPLGTNRTGVQLCYGVLTSKDDYYRFENNKLVSATSTIALCDLNKYFRLFMHSVGGGWVVDLKNMNDSAAQILADLDNTIKTIYKNQKKGGTTDMTFTLTTTGDLVLAYSYIGSGSKASTFNYKFSLAEESGRLHLTYTEPADENAQKVMTALTGLESLLTVLGGDYNLTPTEPFNPTLGMKLTDNTKPELWFHVTGKR